ncbi:MAG TPA: hypothetical protein VEA69_21840 [Tepidisphaeraceae bacterium]|nr:hypothetical protein [Tepidisphaeraceae bacterium]
MGFTVAGRTVPGLTVRPAVDRECARAGLTSRETTGLGAVGAAFVFGGGFFSTGAKMMRALASAGFGSVGFAVGGGVGAAAGGVDRTCGTGEGADFEGVTEYGSGCVARGAGDEATYEDAVVRGLLFHHCMTSRTANPRTGAIASAAISARPSGVYCVRIPSAFHHASHHTRMDSSSPSRSSITLLRSASRAVFPSFFHDGLRRSCFCTFCRAATSSTRVIAVCSFWRTITTETQKGHNYLRCTRKLGPCSQPFVREEEVARQTQAALERVTVPRDWIEWMTAELSEERRRQVAADQQQLDGLRAGIAATEQKLQRLTDAYLEGVLDIDEYRRAKAQRVEKKAGLTERLAQIERNPASWLEPADRFLKALSEATLCAEGDETAEKAKWLKKVGSNLTVRAKTIRYEFNEPWKTAEKHGRFAQPERRASASDARLGGETHHVFTTAEREGFEPSLRI